MARRQIKVVVAEVDHDVFGQLQHINRSLSTLDKAAAKAFQENVRTDFTEPLVGYMKAASRAMGRHGPRLANTLSARGGAVPTVRIGAWSEEVWAGAAFGGRKKVKEAQTMTWPNSKGRPPTRKVIYRHTTYQFLPHLGTTGYGAFPEWRRRDRELSDRLVSSMDRFLRAYTGGE